MPFLAAGCYARPMSPKGNVGQPSRPGEFVPLGVEEFRHAYDVFSAGVAGELPPDPSFPTLFLDASTGAPAPLTDNAFNRAWYAAGKLFADEAKRLSFYARVQHVMPIALTPKYAKYVNVAAGSLHIALLAAVGAVRFSSRTTPKALRSAFDAELRRRLASLADPGHDRRH